MADPEGFAGGTLGAAIRPQGAVVGGCYSAELRPTKLLGA